jgi:hypothetical protein
MRKASGSIHVARTPPTVAYWPREPQNVENSGRKKDNNCCTFAEVSWIWSSGNRRLPGAAAEEAKRESAMLGVIINNENLASL